MIKGGIAIVLLGLLFASVPFFQIIHEHTYAHETSQSNHVKSFEKKCCDPLKIQSHLQAVLNPKSIKIKLIFADNYSFGFYNYNYSTSVKLCNKAPPVRLFG
ncbi:MAG TPA: hypothetical protein VFM79_02055 [Pelobium sp.]|nr:hypothetical protein [Pelobium sp.]